MEEPLLDIDQIQANIAPGFRFPIQHLIAVRVGDTASARRLIAAVLPQITTMREAVAFHSQRLQVARQSYTFSLESFSAIESRPVWVNIGLGQELLEKVGVAAAEDADRSFKLGLDKRSFTLGDPRDASHEGHKSNWLIGGPDNRADVLLIVGSASETSLAAIVESLSNEISDNGSEIIYQERGSRLDDDKEHFGFRDGVSQPGLRGLISQEPDEYLTKRRVQNGPSGPEWSSPGTTLVWPGEFIFGYAQQNPNHFRTPAPFRGVDRFLKNGSFLVFRRLKQDVPLFREDTVRLASELAASLGFEHFTPELFQASLVGRWPDGSPLTRYPEGPPPSPPSEDDINYFNFGNALPDLTLNDSTVVPGVEGDPNGVVCPFHAHIRKVNPRDRATDLGAETNTQRLRILRRGIPYGLPFDQAPDQTDRGLLFLCYQTSIRDQFEQLTFDWVNSTVNPEPGNNEGFDMILGQNGADTNRERFCVFQNGTGNQASVSTLSDWVIPTGGGYFFCPSIDSLATLTDS